MEATTKRLLSMLLVVVLVAGIAISGTLAYLTSTDSDVNVMTLGNVQIEQIEEQLAADGTTEPFEQAKDFYPGTEVSKIVTVKNTGKSDAYFRTLIAFEDIDSETFEIDFPIGEFSGYTWSWGAPEATIVIDGTTYQVYEAVYNNVLKPGETSPASLTKVVLDAKATNEDMEALGDTYEILVFTQAVQTAGFSDAKTALDTAFGDITATNHPWVDGVNLPVVVEDAEELQAALDNAAEGNNTIILNDDIKGDFTVDQKADSKTVIEGNGNTFTGAIVIDGNSSRPETAGITIKNINFKADGDIGEDAFINLGNGSTGTRYTNNVTISNCTFDIENNEEDTVAIKSYTGGDKNLTITGCTVSANMHSLLQVANVEEGLTITDCVVNSKNGINLNSTPYLNMSDCTFNTQGYCVRIGVNGSTNSGNFTISNSTLKSANDDGDAVIIFRGNMSGATMTLNNTTLTGSPEITGDADIVR